MNVLLFQASHAPMHGEDDFQFSLSFGISLGWNKSSKNTQLKEQLLELFKDKQPTVERDNDFQTKVAINLNNQV